MASMTAAISPESGASVVQARHRAAATGGAGRPIVVARKIAKGFNGRTVLNEIDLTIDDGEFVALLGASGSGKSTLLRIFAGLSTADRGELRVPERHATVFQEHRLLPWRRLEENVALGLSRAEAKLRVPPLLAEVGLTERAKAWPLTLSGGEAQRAAVARALAHQPELLLLDEPFGALDALTRIRMHTLLQRLWHLHRPAILLVTHDVDEALALADRILILAEGTIINEIAVALERPRIRVDPQFNALRSSILLKLGVIDG